MKRAIWICMAALLVSTPALSQKPKKGKTGPPTLIQHPGLSVDLPMMPVVVAKQKCENWAWAAAVDTVLRAQNVPLSQTYWLNRLGGEACRQDPGSPDDLIRFMEREPYFLDDGRKLKLHVRFVPGPPTEMDTMLSSIKDNRPVIIFWRGRARVLSGMTYDEYVAVTGAHVFEVREMRLVDLYADPKSPDRIAKFVKGTDPLTDFDGMMQLSVEWVKDTRQGLD